MKSVGLCLGASTVTVVLIDQQGSETKILNTLRLPHEGDPKAVVKKLFDQGHLQAETIGVTGRKFRHIVNLPAIAEPEAVEHALEYALRDTPVPEAVISAGGETFMVYILDKTGKIRTVTTGNKCASGTGEFFLQQIKRMDLSVTEAVEKAMSGDPYPVSGRCSVFCKSDCTHALNKGVSINDVTAGLCQMIASKIHELLLKSNVTRALIIGGGAQNTSVMKYLKARVEDLSFSPHAPYFEALGAALWAVRHGSRAAVTAENLFNPSTTSFEFLPALKSSLGRVSFKDPHRVKAQAGDECIVGLDVGSTTTKAILLRVRDNGIAASVYLRTNGNPILASQNCYRSLLEQLGNTPVKIIGLGTTGSGRQIAGLHALTDGIINEIIAHAKAAVYYDPEVDTIFEIGGQDAKYTHITNSVPSDYAMNEACSAGTGSFLEEVAHESLSIDVKDICDLAMQAESFPNFNDQCAAFISSDIKTAFQEGVSKEAVLAGLVHSVCVNYANRVKGNRPVGKKIFMQGGVCYNRAIPVAMAGLIGKDIVVPPDPGLMGSFGVALEIKSQLEMGFLSPGNFNLAQLAQREVEYQKSFVCGGGKEKCDRKCVINRIKVEDGVYAFGGACNKYYNLLHKINVEAAEFDLVAYRNRLIFETFAPDQSSLPANAPSVGINKTFLIHAILPLFYHYFNQLGVRVVLSDGVDPKGAERKQTSFCYPCEISLGSFHRLLEQKPDYIFMPHIEEMFVQEKAKVRKEFHCTCIFVQGEAFFLTEGFQDRQEEFKAKLLAPTLNFAKGFEAETAAFQKLALKFGKTEAEGLKAFQFGIRQQHAFRAQCLEAGKQVLQKIEANPQAFGMVIIGQPYSCLAKEANKGIPFKYASRGIYTLPQEMLPWEDMPDDPHMFWEKGHRILKLAQYVKQHPQLFGTYIMNFLCAQDSILITYFRDIMGVKPSLTLELDGHSADAGINTRLEAFLDIIRNYRKISHELRDRDYSGFVHSVVKRVGSKTVMVNSQGQTIPLTDPSVKLVIPNMGDATTRLIAATFNQVGIRAVGLPVADNEVLKYGRSNTTCKECLPMILCIGSFLKYIRHSRPAGENTVLFMPAAAGYCRLGQYRIFIRDLLKKLDIRDVAMISLENENRYAGLGNQFMMNSWKAILVGDAMKDIRNSILAMAVDPVAGLRLYEEELEKIEKSILASGKTLYAQLKATARRLATLPRKFELDRANFVAIVGEIFVRRDRFSRQGLIRRLAKEGFVARVAHLSEWIYYMDYMIHQGMFETSHTWQEKLEFKLVTLVEKHIEKKIKKILAASKLLEYSLVDLPSMLAHSTHILPKELKGEPGMVVGMALQESVERYAGIINIGPFGCMPVRYIESVLTPSMTVGGKKAGVKASGAEADLPGFEDEEVLPFLTIETDGNPYPQIIEARIETFCLQAKRMGEKIKMRKNAHS